jgi:AGCS family alanine or glycine:cation symporter
MDIQSLSGELSRALRSFADGIQATADWIFMPWVVIVLLGSGLYLTVRYRFVQVVRFREALRVMVGRRSGTTGVLTPFQAFMTALAATIGTGNIAGVATAIVSGGPGALFWIWVYGLVAPAIKFSEATLGLKYRTVLPDGTIASGPMYYLRDGLRSPALAWLYALVAGVAALTTTPFTQTNSIAVVVNAKSGIPFWAIGVFVAAITFAVIIGGIRAIGRAAEKLSPLKVGLYVTGGLIVIVTHAAQIPETLALVFREAFSTRAAIGTAHGVGVMVAVRYGLARGIYANEAGYGTAAVAYGTAASREPVQQGLNAIMETFIVSFVTSTLSAMVLLLTGAWKSGLTSAAAVAAAFDASLPGVGGWVVAFCVFLFGYTTLIGWAYYGEQFLEYLLGRKVALPYRWIYCLLIPFGAISKVDVVWAWGDFMNVLQVFPNLAGLIGLSGVAAAIARTRLSPAAALDAASAPSRSTSSAPSSRAD